MAILIGLFIIFVGKANILPIKYFAIFLVIFILWIIILFFLLVFKTKKKKNKPRKITGCILSIILIILMGLVTYYMNHTLDFIHNFGENKNTEEKYFVLVLKDSSYQTLEDLKGKNIAYVPNSLTKIEEALKELDNKIKMNHRSYEQYKKAVQDMQENTLESMLIEESNYNILEENNKYGDIFRKLEEIIIKKEVETVSKNVDVTEDPFTIYISGIDNYGAIQTVSRSDVNMLITVHPKTKQVLMVSIPRDYYVQLKGTTGYKDKLTHAGIYGVETSIGTIEDLLNTDINYYFRVNFTTLEKVINAIGGVDVYSKYEFTSTGKYYKFYKGYNHVNGEQALEFARERYHLPQGDRTRGQNQQAVIDAIIRKVTSSAIITKYDDILKSLKDTFQTNIVDKDILKLVRMQLDDMASWNITSYSLNGSDAMEFTYSCPHETLYVMKPNQDTITEATELINLVMKGEKLESSYDKNPSGNIHKPGIDIPAPTPEPTPDPTPEEPTTDEPNPLDPILPNDDTQTPVEPKDDNEESNNPPVIDDPVVPIQPVDPTNPVPVPSIPKDTI